MKVLRHLDLPPVWQASIMVVMALLDRFLPLAAPVQGAWRTLGLWIMAAGFLWALAAVLQMMRHHTSPHPHDEPSRLLERGFFALSRNPIYLGMAVLVAGFALWLGSLSPWIGPPAYVALISGRFIRGEEAKLERAFGPAFERYRRRVRRWI